MFVICDNRDKEWCPFHDTECYCDAYFPKMYDPDHEDYDKDKWFCVDKYWKDRECGYKEVDSEIDYYIKEKKLYEISFLKGKIEEYTKKLKELESSLEE